MKIMCRFLLVLCKDKKHYIDDKKGRRHNIYNKKMHQMVCTIKQMEFEIK